MGCTAEPSRPSLSTREELITKNTLTTSELMVYNAEKPDAKIADVCQSPDVSQPEAEVRRENRAERL